MSRHRILLLLCAAAFMSAVWGSVDCGMRLSDAGLSVDEAAHLRRLIYLHFALAQAALFGAALLFYLHHRSWKRYYLLVSYKEQGMRLEPPGIHMPASRVYRCTLSALTKGQVLSLPPDDAPVLVYPLFMLSGQSSGAKLERALHAAYAARGQEPELFYQPVLGASPWLARAAAKHLRPLLREDMGVLVVAHGSPMPEPPPEPALFCRRLREHLPQMEVALGYFNQSPLATDVLRGMKARQVLLLPFLLTEGLHTSRDLPTAADAAACGKTLERMPVAADLLKNTPHAL